MVGVIPHFKNPSSGGPPIKFHAWEFMSARSNPALGCEIWICSKCCEVAFVSCPDAEGCTE